MNGNNVTSPVVFAFITLKQDLLKYKIFRIQYNAHYVASCECYFGLHCCIYTMSCLYHTVVRLIYLEKSVYNYKSMHN